MLCRCNQPLACLLAEACHPPSPCAYRCKAVAWTSMAAATAFWFVNDNAPAAGSQGCCKAGSGCGRLWGATFTVVAKHLGSLAVGSFCIALCQLLRLMLLALDRATKAQRPEP